MDRAGENPARATLQKSFGSNPERRPGRDHVIDNDGSLTANVADHLDELGRVRAGTLLRDYCQRSSGAEAKLLGTVHATRIRTHRDQILDAHLAERGCQ